MLLKTFRDRAAPVSVLVSFAEVRGRPRRTGPGRSSRSQTTLTCRERTSTDLESELGNTRENGPTAAPNGIGPKRGNRARFAGQAPGKPAPRPWKLTVPG